MNDRTRSIALCLLSVSRCKADTHLPYTRAKQTVKRRSSTSRAMSDEDEQDPRDRKYKKARTSKVRRVTADTRATSNTSVSRGRNQSQARESAVDPRPRYTRETAPLSKHLDTSRQDRDWTIGSLGQAHRPRRIENVINAACYFLN